MALKRKDEEASGSQTGLVTMNDDEPLLLSNLQKWLKPASFAEGDHVLAKFKGEYHPAKVRKVLPGTEQLKVVLEVDGNIINLDFKDVKPLGTLDKLLSDTEERFVNEGQVPPHSLQMAQEAKERVSLRGAPDDKERAKLDVETSQDFRALPWDPLADKEDVDAIMDKLCSENVHSFMNEFRRNCCVHTQVKGSDAASSSRKISWTITARNQRDQQNRPRPGPLAGNVLAYLPMASGVAVAVPSSDALDVLSGYLVPDDAGKSGTPLLIPSKESKLQSPILDVRTQGKNLLYMRSVHEVCVASANVSAETSELLQPGFTWLHETFRQQVEQPTRDLCTSPHMPGVFAVAHTDGLRVWDTQSDGLFDFWGTAESHREFPFGDNTIPNAICWWKHPDMLAMASADVSIADLRCNSMSKIISRHILQQGIPLWDSVSALAWLPRYEHQLSLLISPGAASVFDTRMPSNPLHLWSLPREPSSMLPKDYYRALSWAEDQADGIDWMIAPQIGGCQAVALSRQAVSGMEFEAQPAAFLESDSAKDVFLGAAMKYWPELNSRKGTMHLFCLMSKSGVVCCEVVEKARTGNADSEEAESFNEAADSEISMEAVAASNWLRNAGAEVAAVLKKLGFGKRTQPDMKLEESSLQSSLSDEDFLGAVAATMADFWSNMQRPLTQDGRAADTSCSPAMLATSASTTPSAALEAGSPVACAAPHAPSAIPASTSVLAVDAPQSSTMPQTQTPSLPVDNVASGLPESERQAMSFDLENTLEDLEVSLPDDWVTDLTLHQTYPDYWSVAELVDCAVSQSEHSYSDRARTNGVRVLTRALACKGLLQCRSNIVDVPANANVASEALELYRRKWPRLHESTKEVRQTRSKLLCREPAPASELRKRLKEVLASGSASDSGIVDVSPVSSESVPPGVAEAAHEGEGESAGEDTAQTQNRRTVAVSSVGAAASASSAAAAMSKKRRPGF